MLKRVFEKDEGSIMIEGKDKRKVRRSQMRKDIEKVFKDEGLLKRQVEENIRVGRENEKNEEVKEEEKDEDENELIIEKREG